MAVERNRSDPAAATELQRTITPMVIAKKLANKPSTSEFASAVRNAGQTGPCDVNDEPMSKRKNFDSAVQYCSYHGLSRPKSCLNLRAASGERNRLTVACAGSRIARIPRKTIRLPRIMTGMAESVRRMMKRSIS